MQNEVNRYSDAELAEFRELIENKLEKAREQLANLESQLLEINENNDSGYDLDDDSSNSYDKELLNEMAIRQKKYIQDLENAFIRIKNKSYGICVVTGTLIDKKRLLAVPTTTKSLAAKLYKPEVIVEEDEEQPKREAPARITSTPKTITTKITKKSAANPKSSAPKQASIPDDEFGFLDEEEDIVGTPDNEWVYVEMDEGMEVEDTISDHDDTDDSSFDDLPGEEPEDDDDDFEE